MQVVDFVTAPDPVELAALGLGAVPYTGSGRPSQGWFDACRARGIPIPWMIQETTSTRSQQGFQAGVFDCEFAQRRCADVGHAGAICAVVSDGNGGDRWDSSAYGAGWRSVATVPYFPYGALSVTGSFLAGAAGPLCIQGEWVPETWGAGRVASQLVYTKANLSTPHDLNDVLHDFGQEADDMFTDDDRKLLGELRLYLIDGPTSTAGRVFDIQQKVDAIIVANAGDGTGITAAQIAAVQDVVALLRGNGASEAQTADKLAAAFGV